MEPRISYAVPPWFITHANVRIELREDSGRYQLELSEEREGAPDGNGSVQIDLSKSEASRLVEHFSGSRVD